MTTQPAILIVSGGCHVPAHFVPLQGVLEAYGYEVINPRLISNSLHSRKGGNFNLDKAMLISIVESLAHQGKGVIVLMHSYGGFLATEAMAGLGIKTRQAAGLRGGVRWLAYMTALIPVIGETFSDTMKLAGPVDRTALGGSFVNGACTYPENPAAAFYHDLPPNAQEHWCSLLTGLAIEVSSEKLSREAWRDIDVSYMHTLQDRALTLRLQKAMVERIRSLGVPVREVILNSSHSPFLSRTQDVLKWINELGDVPEWNKALS